MSQFVKLSAIALACLGLMATRVVADELEEVSAEVPSSTEEAQAASLNNGSASLPELNYANYKTEALLLAIAVGMMVNYFYGAGRNKQIIRKLEKPISDVLHRNFTLVGNGVDVFDWDSAADVLFYASGRRHCKLVQGHVQLKARQDIVALVNDLLANNNEKVEIEVTFNDDAFDGFVFAAIPRKRSKAVMRDRYDIGTFSKLTNNNKISPKIAICSENADATAQLLASGLEDILSENKPLLEELYITDNPETKPESHDFKREKKMLAVIRIPSLNKEGMDKFKEMVEFVFYLVDYVAEAIKLRPESVKKLTKARDEAYKEFARMAEQEKQDALAKMQAEKRRNELEEVSRMTPAQRRKWEEKDRKRQLKKEQSKRVRRVK